MEYVDYIIFAIIIISILVGAIRGFIKEAFSLAVWVAAFLVAFQYSGGLAQHLESQIELPSVRTALAFAGLFLSVLLVGGLLTFLVGKLVEKTGLSGTDRLFGGVFGGVRGLILVLALIPLAMGAAWMIAMMNLFGIVYNLANVVAIPLLMGIGVVYCVHIIHRFRQEGENNVYDVVRHTGGAVFLAAMTTMIGFGALTAGSHGGMKSMGRTMLIGIFTCMVTALVVLPAMLRMLPSVRKAEAELDKSGEHPFKAPKKQKKDDEPGPDSPGSEVDAAAE